MQKILQHHEHFEMDAFFAFDLKVLPVVLTWFERAKDSTSHDVDTHLLSAMYQFNRAFPMLFLPSSPNCYPLFPPPGKNEYDVQLPGKLLLYLFVSHSQDNLFSLPRSSKSYTRWDSTKCELCERLHSIYGLSLTSRWFQRPCRAQPPCP